MNANLTKKTRDLAARIKRSEFIKFSSLFFVGSFAVSVLNYLYRFIVARMLGPADYGVVAAMLSLAYVVSIPASRVTMIAMKYVSAFQAKRDLRQIRGFFYTLTIYLFPASFVILLVFLALSGIVAKFLHLSSTLPVILIGLTIIVALVGPLNKGILQGLKRFAGLSLIMVIEASAKVLFAGVLISLSFGANGAVIAIFLAMITSYLCSFVPLRDYIGRERLRVSLRDLSKYSGAVLLAGVGSMILMNADILLVKHFFPAVEAGQYAAASSIGKIILFLSSPIAGVMFPMVSERHERNEAYHHLVRRTLMLVSLISLAILFVLFIAPEFVIGLLFGREFVDAASYLPILGVFGMLLSLNSVYLHYFLSVRKNSFIPFLLGTGLVLIVLIYMFHSSLMQVSIMVVISISMLVVCMILLYFRSVRS